MSFTQNLLVVRARIDAACTAAARPRTAVQLLAVSKTIATERIRVAAGAGQRCFGENYVQEALPKIAALTDLGLEWHHIGPIQSNKTADIAQCFDWAHGVERLKIAERLSAQRPLHLPPLNICLQVNVSGEASKSGCRPQDCAALCGEILLLPGLRLRGLMALPAPATTAPDSRAAFRVLRLLFETLQAVAPGADTLSMGMSDDLESAIAEGATLVRVGSALFGARSTGKLALNPAS